LTIDLAWVWIRHDLHDRDFLASYTVGFERFAAYVCGETDGTPKDPDWAAAICDLPAEAINNLAQRMAKGRTMISLSWSLTRHDHGEQPFWLGTVLAAMLGQIGLPGGGVGFGYGATNTVGLERDRPRFQALPQGKNPVTSFIPVARITELLENPGARFYYNGQLHHYPDTQFVWWAGGKIEIFPETISGFNLADCPGHPCWMEPLEWLGSDKSAECPLHLISSQPHNKLHSQLDHGALSRADRSKGYEPAWLHPLDAAEYGISEGDVIRVF
jgi:anaerobic selenocysteine-containing dehydrogenase